MPDPLPVHKSDPTISGFRNWDERKYKVKIGNIIKVFEAITDSERVLPAVIALSEVQGRKPLEDILASGILTDYEIVHYNSSDPRGMDVALLYHTRKLQLISSQPVTFNNNSSEPENEGEGTRDILHCEFSLAGKIISIFVLHLPSQRDKDIKADLRAAIIENLNKKLSEPKFGNQAVVICGDFNTNPDDDLLKKMQDCHHHRKNIKNPYADLFATGNFSTYHQSNGLLFDQIMVSKEFFQTGYPLQFKEAKIFKPAKIQTKGKKFGGRPARTFVGTRYIGGYSDHFPVITEFIKF